MEKMWSGRTAGKTSDLADQLNSSIGIDGRMYAEDIQGSIAHAKMLAKQKIISEEEAVSMENALSEIREEIENGMLPIDESAEDIHMFVEAELTKRIGDIGKKVHTARSRNDQVATDTRLYLRNQLDGTVGLLTELLKVIRKTAEENIDVVMPGYTHLQHAQPVLFSHYFLSYAWMLVRDVERLRDARKRLNISPIGACALAGTTYDTDRQYEAALLGFDGVTMNSIDSVSDRDFCIELLSCFSILQMHLSRMAEELVLFSSQEFSFIEFSDAFTTGSSIMPQKKNPDMAELIRGKTGRVYGDLITLLVTLKGLPLAYNKDMQEDKEAVFDANDTVQLCLRVLIPMIGEMKVNADAMLSGSKAGFMNATDLADYLAKKGMPFRDAYKISGSIVHECIEKGLTLETFPLEGYRKYSPLIAEDIYEAIDVRTCVSRRTSFGGTSKESVLLQLKNLPV